MRHILLLKSALLFSLISNAQLTLDSRVLYATNQIERVNSVDLSYPGYILSAQNYTDAWLPFYDNGLNSALRRFPITASSTTTNILFGSTGLDEGVDMKFKNGSLYAIGHFTGTVPFHNGVGTAINRNSGSTTGIYITKYTTAEPSVNEFVQVIKSNTISSDLTIKDMDIDDGGNVYVTGNYTGSANFNNGIAGHDRAASSYGSIFFAKYDGTDGTPIWVKGLDFYEAPPAGAYFSSNAIALDELGNIYIAGRLCRRVDMDPGPGYEDISLVATGCMFIAKYDSDGNYIDHIRVSSNNNNNEVYDMKIKNSAIYITGRYSGTNFFLDPVSLALFPSEHMSGGNMFVAKYNLDLNHQWSNYAISEGPANGNRLDVDNYGNVYTITHLQYETNMNPKGVAVNYNPSGNQNVAITAYNPTGEFQWSTFFGHGGGGANFINGFAITPDGRKIVMGGYFIGTINFNLNGGVDNIISNAYTQDGFITIYNIESPLSVKAGQLSGNLENSNTAILNWETFEETDNKGFQLEKSPDGKHFEPLHFVKSNYPEGSGNVTTAYFFRDNNYSPKYPYYRYAQSSNDGKINYSNVVLINPATQSNTKAICYPNPTTQILNIDNVPKNSSINIFNTFGTLVYHQDVSGTKHAINVSQWTNGHYYIQISQNERVVEQIQFVIKK